MCWSKENRATLLRIYASWCIETLVSSWKYKSKRLFYIHFKFSLLFWWRCCTVFAPAFRENHHRESFLVYTILARTFYSPGRRIRILQITTESLFPVVSSFNQVLLFGWGGNHLITDGMNLTTGLSWCKRSLATQWYHSTSSISFQIELLHYFAFCFIQLRCETC